MYMYPDIFKNNLFFSLCTSRPRVNRVFGRKFMFRGFWKINAPQTIDFQKERLFIVFVWMVKNEGFWIWWHQSNSALDHKLNSSTIDKRGEWCLERRVRPRIKPSQTHRVSMTTLWAAATHLALSHWQVSGNKNTYHILTKARGRGGPGIKSQRELSKSNSKMQMTWHPKSSCKRRGAPAQHPRPPRTRTLGDTACQHCLLFNLT